VCTEPGEIANAQKVSLTSESKEVGRKMPNMKEVGGKTCMLGKKGANKHHVTKRTQ
jgi:hypothetical protein